jgi:hypothetical protein
VRLVAFAAVAMVAIAGHLAQLGHFLLVSHRMCEHGALVHETQAEAEELALHAAERQAEHEDRAGTREGRRTLPDAAGQGDGDGEHGHCDPFALRSSATLTEPFCLDVAQVDASVLPWSMRPHDGARAISILSLAPKSSPPV